jgi:hypothetical protein
MLSVPKPRSSAPTWVTSGTRRDTDWLSPVISVLWSSWPSACNPLATYDDTRYCVADVQPLVNLGARWFHAALLQVCFIVLVSNSRTRGWADKFSTGPDKWHQLSVRILRNEFNTVSAFITDDFEISCVNVWMKLNLNRYSFESDAL